MDKEEEILNGEKNTFCPLFFSHSFLKSSRAKVVFAAQRLSMLPSLGHKTQNKNGSNFFEYRKVVFLFYPSLQKLGNKCHDRLGKLSAHWRLIWWHRHLKSHTTHLSYFNNLESVSGFQSHTHTVWHLLRWSGQTAFCSGLTERSLSWLHSENNLLWLGHQSQSWTAEWQNYQLLPSLSLQTFSGTCSLLLRVHAGY